MSWRVFRVRFVSAVVSCLILALAGVPALASSSVSGPSGLVNTPSADVVDQGALRVGFHSFEGDAFASLSYGIAENVEVGIATVNAERVATEIMGNFKIRLIEESGDFPSVAAGLDDDAYYLVLSKELGRVGMRAHLGMGTGRLNGLFGGVSMMLNPVTVSSREWSTALPVVTLIAEYDGRNANLGAKLNFTPELVLDLAISDMESFAFGGSFQTRF